MEFNAAMALLEVGLSLWLSKEKTKYQDKYLKLKGELDEERLLGENASDKRIDDLERELCNLANSFTYAAKSESIIKPG